MRTATGQRPRSQISYKFLHMFLTGWISSLQYMKNVEELAFLILMSCCTFRKWGSTLEQQKVQTLKPKGLCLHLVPKHSFIPGMCPGIRPPFLNASFLICGVGLVISPVTHLRVLTLQVTIWWEKKSFSIMHVKAIVHIMLEHLHMKLGFRNIFLAEQIPYLRLEELQHIFGKQQEEWTTHCPLKIIT